MSARDYTPLDGILMNFDTALRTLFGSPPQTGRAHPAAQTEEGALSDAEQKESARLMRINHTGEVCAQALYQGQALTARDDSIRETMQHAAAEENDHLAWCAERVAALGSHTSYLNPLFYLGSLTIGVAAGIAGDRWSLGFLAETERQVVRHLEGHLERLPKADAKSRAIVEQMKIDEGEHASAAVASGAADLPRPIRDLMTASSRVMTSTTYWM
ncbi:demethoxyubiquinone hydroxylase family protein [Alkalilimnicola ehrlichii]|uniref:3-demethoxyubiquinol 3-hydroxylase n=1 Tax=Alkalilimnicola ehrlichii TaxID=351052 RepID=A0A3E0X3S1_9GAMM|nr:2-polyprenyl-3-methyl-6-methoxy-1,4-benzoquinone monooxygenase [Alkalilimnicola ehrlichii]RFA31232.1 demethoxyubiquinone hydroxylase family protein [Alkalilimnicola ehrlichii]RFA39490.1 demethoxyubiquinone hydroxylase family protein [Alkalilimnicola ehrlichii]